jgi:hypothetical protein
MPVKWLFSLAHRADIPQKRTASSILASWCFQGGLNWWLQH